MKKFYPTLIVLALLYITNLSTSKLQAQEWTEFASLPDGFISHHSFGFSFDGLGYLVTGTSRNGETKLFYQYDPVQDEWTRLPDFPGLARGFAIGDQWNGKAYLGFGANNNGERMNDLWEFDPETQTWKQLSNCPCLGRIHPAFIAHNGKIFMGMGGTSNGNSNDWWVYDIATDQWSQGTDFPDTRRHHPYQFGLGDYVYTGFGHGDGIFDEWYQYDVSTDTWDQMATLPSEGRVAGTQFDFLGDGYVLSGDGDDHSYMDTGEFWKYDNETNSWESLDPHPGLSRWAPSSFRINEYIYFINGVDYLPFEYATVNYKYPLLTKSIAENSALDCFGDSTASVTLSVNGADEGLFNYQWSNGDTTVTASNLKAGWHYVEITADDLIMVDSVFIGQPDQLILSIDSVYASSGIDGEIEYTINGGTGQIEVILQLVGTIPDTIGVYTNGDLINGLLPGEYFLTLVDEKGCRLDSDVFTVESEATSINELTLSRFKILSNPFNETLAIEWDQQEPINFITVWNAKGQKVASSIDLNQNPIKIDLANQPSGMYWLEIEDRVGKEVLKAVKQ